MNSVVSFLRVTLGVVVMAIAVAVFAALCLLLLPWRGARIKVCNVFGHLIGPTTLWLAGARVHGVDHARLRASFPAIYVSNHSSALDIFLGIWLAPIGVVGIAKKEVVYYPFFGQLYYLSGHLRLDRQNRASAVEALASVAEVVRARKLGIWMWPEGTRSRDGRLLPFKKGIVHLAVATRLPIVPVVITGAHRAWRKGSLELHPTDIGVKVLDPIVTSDWSAETIEHHLAELHTAFERELPPEQLPEVRIPA